MRKRKKNRWLNAIQWKPTKPRYNLSYLVYWPSLSALYASRWKSNKKKWGTVYYTRPILMQLMFLPKASKNVKRTTKYLSINTFYASRWNNCKKRRRKDTSCIRLRSNEDNVSPQNHNTNNLRQVVSTLQDGTISRKDEGRILCVSDWGVTQVVFLLEDVETT